jgi:antitoxin (DNA-binding transcriptional repressor) of toxin-antitoxin stability system
MRVDSGETFVITRNGEPVAELKALRPISSMKLIDRVRAISVRVRERNRDREPWPPNAKSFREIAHARNR